MPNRALGIFLPRLIAMVLAPPLARVWAELNRRAARARLLNLAGRYREVADDYEKEIERAGRHGHARLLHEIAVAYSCLPESDLIGQAARLLERVVDLYDPEADRLWLSLAYADLVLLYDILGKLPELRIAHAKGLRFAENLPLATVRLMSQSSLLAEPEKAVRQLESAAEEAHRRRLPREEARCLNNLGVALHAAGRREPARLRFRDAFVLFLETQGGDCTDVPLTNLGVLDLEENVDPTAAEPALREALELAGECSAALSIESNLTVALFGADKKDEALSRSWSLFQRARSLGDPVYLEQVGHNLSRCLIESGEARTALSVLKGYRPYSRQAQEQPFADARKASLVLAASWRTGQKPPAAAREQTRFFESLPRESPYRQPWILSPIELL